MVLLEVLINFSAVILGEKTVCTHVANPSVAVPPNIKEEHVLLKENKQKK
jgi:hypothetical protein